MESSTAEATGCGPFALGARRGGDSPKRAGDPGHAVREERTDLDGYLPITHEVDDVEHWLSSPKREELFGPMGVAVRTFRDPDGSNKTALIAEIPDMKAFKDVMKSQAAADAMKHDGVNPETLLIFSEA
jgi:hypothetical protein